MAELAIQLDYSASTNHPDFDDGLGLENQDEEAVAMMDESPEGGISISSFIIEICLHVMIMLFQHCSSLPASFPMLCFNFVFSLATLIIVPEHFD